MVVIKTLVLRPVQRVLPSLYSCKCAPNTAVVFACTFTHSSKLFPQNSSTSLPILTLSYAPAYCFTEKNLSYQKIPTTTLHLRTSLPVNLLSSLLTLKVTADLKPVTPICILKILSPFPALYRSYNNLHPTSSIFPTPLDCSI